MMAYQSVQLVILVLVGGTFAECPCPQPAFNVIRQIPGIPDIQQQIFTVMQTKYKSGLDILTKSLAKDTIQSLDSAVDKSTFVMDVTDHCMSATIKDATFLIDGKTLIADFIIQGKALADGVSTAICQCDQKDKKSSEIDICKGYLHGETEKHMNEVQTFFEMKSKKPTK